MSYFKRDGFSLLELMIAIGLVGVASMGTVGIMKMSYTSSKTSDITLEINAITNSIFQTLVNPNSCTNTFNKLGPISDTTPIGEIINHLNKVAFNTAKKHGTNRVIITDMVLNNVDISPAKEGSSKKLGNFNLNIKLEKLGKGYTGQKLVNKDFSINAEFDLNNQLVKCYSSLEDSVLSAEKGTCQIFGGTWDGTTKTCTLGSSVALTIAASTEELKNILNELKDNFLPQNYVQKIGDNMTGSLTISGADLNANVVNATDFLKAANTVCVGTKCRDFTKKQCSKNSIMIGLGPDGTPICTVLQCPDGFYFEKLNPTSGSVMCKALPIKACPANQYVSEVGPNGSTICSPLPSKPNQQCPNGQYVKRVMPNGTVNCSNPVQSFACSGTQYVSGFDSTGIPRCSP